MWKGLEQSEHLVGLPQCCGTFSYFVCISHLVRKIFLFFLLDSIIFALTILRMQFLLKIEKQNLICLSSKKHWSWALNEGHQCTLYLFVLWYGARISLCWGHYGGIIGCSVCGVSVLWGLVVCKADIPDTICRVICKKILWDGLHSQIYRHLSLCTLYTKSWQSTHRWWGSSRVQYIKAVKNGEGWWEILSCSLGRGGSVC